MRFSAFFLAATLALAGSAAQARELTQQSSKKALDVVGPADVPATRKPNAADVPGSKKPAAAENKKPEAPGDAKKAGRKLSQSSTTKKPAAAPAPAAKAATGRKLSQAKSTKPLSSSLLSFETIFLLPGRSRARQGRALCCGDHEEASLILAAKKN